ncbi:hypothetical protein Ddc_22694 [Ditylenchus destructor]|nr:hypothetical protein Ddc_22694 [Ditylenchus destructor]
MTRLTAKDFAPELLELYDGYAHGKINRREFLDRAALFTFGGLTASALLAALSPNYALAEQVKFTDPDIVADYLTYPSPKVMAACAATSCARPKPWASCRRWWWSTKTAASTLTSKTSPGAWLKPASSPWPRMA